MVSPEGAESISGIGVPIVESCLDLALTLIMLPSRPVCPNRSSDEFWNVLKTSGLNCWIPELAIAEYMTAHGRNGMVCALSQTQFSFGGVYALSISLVHQSCGSCCCVSVSLACLGIHTSQPSPPHTQPLLCSRLGVCAWQRYANQRQGHISFSPYCRCVLQLIWGQGDALGNVAAPPLLLFGLLVNPLHSSKRHPA